LRPKSVFSYVNCDAIKLCSRLGSMKDKTSLSHLYSRRFPSSQREAKLRLWRELIDGFFQREIDSAGGGKVLEIASGYGEFISQVRCEEKFALDLNPDAEDFVGEEVSFVCESSTKLGKLGFDNLDVIFVSNFLEHLESKLELEQLLVDSLECLKPTGKLIIMGPNLRYLPGKYWDFYDHHLGLTHLSLIEVLDLKGFEIEKVIPKFLPYTASGPYPSHHLLVRLYLKLPWFWKVLGKQFLVVARRRQVTDGGNK
jgi:SAM-dependent methyltransferase